MTNDGLPDYESPPVVETILGVQFDPVEKLTAPLLGLFWSAVRDDWPNVSEAPYLESKFERFGTDHQWSPLRFQMREGHPPIRLQLRNENSDQMIQTQNSRLHFNWMGYEGAQYPRYPAVRDLFADAWKRFTAFVAKEKLGQISPNQWEVTYINHIPVGTVWQNPRDWNFMRLLGKASVLDDLAELEAFQGRWRFALPNNEGRLHVSWKTAKRRHPDNPDEEQEIVVIEQTARGSLPNDTDENDVLRGLDTGREVIVRSFTKLMVEDAKNFWGYQS